MARDDVLMELVDKAMNDADFRSNMQKDPEGTLKLHGFELQEDELEAVKAFQAETQSMSDEEIAQKLQNRQFTMTI